MSSPIYMIDTTSPFFVKRFKSTINWSKAPFARLEKKGRPRKRTFKEIQARFKRYIKRVKSYGFNAVSLDELCYLVEFTVYPDKVARNILRYRRFLGRLIDTAVEAELAVYLTTDVIFSNPILGREFGQDFPSQCALLSQAVEQVLHDFPELAGIIFRIGESDGVDVEGFFRSKLLIRTPEQANRLIRALLPLFEASGKQLIFRTWSAGAYEIGDLMWNPRTLRRTLKGIDSPNFILSMKYGEADFFRYLELCRHFERSRVRFLVELQTRREYEGFGAYPSFVGWEYISYRRRLKELPNMAGIHVWCQTGGWSRFRNFTFMKGSSLWNELNTWITIRIFRYDESVAQGLKKFHRRFLRRGRTLKRTKRVEEVKRLSRFLRLSDRLVRQVLYLPDFASRRRYFFRMRVPPLLHAFWDSMTITPLFRGLFREAGCRGPEVSFADMRASLSEMRSIAEELKLPYDAEFHAELFTIFYRAQEALCKDDPQEAEAALKELIPPFNGKYGDLYRFQLRNLNRPVATALAGIAARLLLRPRRPYRALDRLLFHPALRFIVLGLVKIAKRGMPEFVDTQAMSIEELLR